jgi:hypothetical protein
MRKWNSRKKIVQKLLPNDLPKTQQDGEKNAKNAPLAYFPILRHFSKVVKEDKFSPHFPESHAIQVGGGGAVAQRKSVEEISN